MPQRESMTQTSGPACVSNTRIQRIRRTLGTTLIEVLVVIVVFLIGILAAIQIFPKGFQLLLLNRSKAVAQLLARDYVETLKAHPDQLPEQIVADYYDNGTLIIDSSKDPNDLSTLAANLNGNGLPTDANGIALGNGNQPWQFFTASNVYRRIIGEGRRVPSPREVGAGTTQYFGGLMVLQFGPVLYLPNVNAANPDNQSNVSVYGNDLEQIVAGTSYQGVQYNGLSYVGIPPYQLLRTDYQYFVSNAYVNSSAYPTAISLPSGSVAAADDQYYAVGVNPHRDFRVSFSAYVLNNSGGLTKRDYTGLSVTVAGQPADASGQYPLSPPVSLQALVNSIPAYATDQIQSVDLNTLTVQRFFLPIAKNAAGFSSDDPYQYKLLNENLGVLLFNPIGNSTFVSREGHDREPLSARVDYDVYDWRILHDDFRIDAGILPGGPAGPNPQALIAQHKLPVGSLKVAGMAGADGLFNTPIATLETQRIDGTTDTSAANGPKTDNFVLMDMDTGGVFCEVNNNPGAAVQNLITVDKSTGIVTMNDADGDPTNGITGELLLPDGTFLNVQMDNRAVRALYMTTQEYSVQVLKAASQYTVSSSPVNLSVGQFYIGGTVVNGVAGPGLPWRIYFPQADNGRKVTVGEMTYNRNPSVDTYVHDMLAQDFLVKSRPDPSLSLPSLDLTDADPNAVAISFQNGIGARGIKGMSVAVRVLWNPATFHLTNDSATNLTNLNNWGQSWRITTNETFLQKEDNNR